MPLMRTVTSSAIALACLALAVPAMTQTMQPAAPRGQGVVPPPTQDGGVPATSPGVRAPGTAHPELAAPGLPRPGSEQTGAAIVTPPGALSAGLVGGQMVFQADGQQFGRVMQVVRGGDGAIFLVIAAPGNRRPLVPLDQMALHDGRPVIRASLEEVRRYPDYWEGTTGFQPLPPEEPLRFSAP